MLPVLLRQGLCAVSIRHRPVAVVSIFRQGYVFLFAFVFIDFIHFILCLT